MTRMVSMVVLTGRRTPIILERVRALVSLPPQGHQGTIKTSSHPPVWMESVPHPGE